MKTKFLLSGILSLALVFGFIGCGSTPEGGSGKAVDPYTTGKEKSDLETKLSEASANNQLNIAGKDLTFDFGGGLWNSKAGGAYVAGGTFTSEDTTDAEGNVTASTVTLTQTHIYSLENNPITKKPLAWVATPGPAIVLDYVADPTSLTIHQ